MPLPLELVALAALIMGLGAMLQAAVGFGGALIWVPLLALIDTALVPGPTLMASLALAGAMAYRERGAIQTGQLAVALIGLAVGTVAAAAALTVIARGQLPTVFATLILAGVVLSVAGLRPAVSRASLVVGGIAAGIMGTMAGLHGPPIALVYQSEAGERVRATLGAFFIVCYATALFALNRVGLFGAPEALLGAALMPGVIAGYAASRLLSAELDGRRLRLAILVVSAGSALALLFK